MSIEDEPKTIIQELREADDGDSKAAVLEKLSTSLREQTAKQYLPPIPELVCALLDFLEREQQDVLKLSVFDILERLSTVPDNQALMVSADQRLLPVVSNAIRREADDSRIKAAVVLMNLSYSEINKVPMASPDLGLLPVLVHVLQDDKGVARAKACATIMSLAIATENEVPMASPDLCLLSALVHVLQEDKGDARASACGAIKNLAFAKENKVPMASPDLGLLPALIHVLREDKGDARTSACGSIMALAVAKENRVPMASPDLGLLSVLVNVIREDRGDARAKACAAIMILAAPKENKVLMASPDLGLLTALVHILEDDKGDARTWACEAIKNLANDIENRVPMASPDLRLLPALVHVLVEDKGDARTNACGAVINLAISKENRVPMASPDLGLLSALVHILREDKGDARANACGAIKNLAFAKENKIPMASPDLGLLPALVHVLREDKGDARARACAAIMSLAIATENEVPMASPDLGLLSALVHVLQEDKGDARASAFGAIKNLAFAKENKVLMASPYLGLLSALVHVLREDNGDARTSACGLIVSLAFAKENRVPMASPDLGLLSALVHVLQEEKGDARAKACGAIMSLALANENRVLMASPDLGLLSALVHVIREVKRADVIGDETGAELSSCLTVLHYISLADENIAYFTCPDSGLIQGFGDVFDTPTHIIEKHINNLVDNVSFGLLPLLTEVLQVDKGDNCLKSLKALKSIAFDAVAKVQIASERLGLLPVLVNILHSNSTNRDLVIEILFSISVGENCHHINLVSHQLGLLPILLGLLNSVTGETRQSLAGFFWNIAEHSTVDLALRLLDSKSYVVMIDLLLKAGPDPKHWIDDYPRKILCFLMNLARFDFASTAIKATNVVDFMQQILLHDVASERLKAIFILAFTIGRDEFVSSNVRFTEQDLSLLLLVFTNTLASKGGTGYNLGTFCIKLIVCAIQAIATSDMNRQLLVNEPQLLDLLLSTLGLFLSNSSEIRSCGGGGHDVAAATATIETLLHLSFAFDNDIDLQMKFMTPNLGIPALLHKCLQDPPVDGRSKLPSSSLRSVNILLKRLSSTPTVLSSPAKTYSGDRHIMISYAWGTKKNLVLEFCQELGSLGLCIWRDEVGSAVVPPMSGSTDDRMAEAIEKSSHVIICISRSYKTSANCRMEANYANDLFKKSKLNVIFVMMEEDYHTRSTPDQVDGWLGFMVGGSLWYSLWESGKVNSTARAVFTEIQSGQANGVPSSLPSCIPSAALAVSTTVSAPSTPHSAETALEKIWKIMHDSRTLLDSSAMENILETHGIIESEVLTYCEEVDIFQQIKNLIKPLPARMFAKLVEDLNGMKLK